MTPAAIEEYPLFIAGQPVETGRLYSVKLPYDGTVAGNVHEANSGTLTQAVDAAYGAASVMARMSNAERSDLLLRALDLLKRDAPAMARILALETGKPIREARFEVERARQTLLWSAIAARELSGEVVPIDAAPIGKGRIAMTIREPLGVIGAITPFNIPLNLAMHKVGPALAGGNAVVHKPSEITPLSALRLAALFSEAGLPPGAYNVITGDGPAIGQAMVRDDRIRMITFTGSVAVGKEIRASAGLKRVTLELGGNSPVIIEPDADLDLALERIVPGAFSHSGQLCISVQRVFVHEQIADQFLDRFRRATERLAIGHPLEEATEVSSLISEEEAERVEEWIADAETKGARRVTGGVRRGATVTPCIVQNLPPDARMACQEVFGPVVAVNRYSDLDEAIRCANDTPYGLQAGIFTRDLARAFDAARKLQSGGVLINDTPSFRADHMPYGGSKESGVGREGPRYAIEEMTEVKLICWR